MSDIVLVTINARYGHAALGPRALMANLGTLRSRAVLKEFLSKDDPQAIVEAILAENPRVVAFSIAIWNVALSRNVMELLKKLKPELPIIVGGPEYRFAQTTPVYADVLVRGEGEETFPRICTDLLEGRRVEKIIDADLVDLSKVALPYGEYDDEDLRQRIISIEASRGCPFQCEFCLSSRDDQVRALPMERLLRALDDLIERGCRNFKFIDRTFNLKLKDTIRILEFFHSRWPWDPSGELIGPEVQRQPGRKSDRGEGFFLHFEVIPDRFDDALIDALSRFPDGGVQLEMGVQTLNPDVGARISRRVDEGSTARNIALLKSRTGVHLHADLIAGLPGEDLNGFGRSFDALRAMGPDEIQLGILKLLPGAPIIRHAKAFGMIFNPNPPYDVLQTDRIDFMEMQEMKRLAKYYEMFANTGRFTSSMVRVMDGDAASAFASFRSFARWIYGRTGQDHAISQPRKYALLHQYLHEILGESENSAGKLLIADYLKNGNQRYLPEFLRDYQDS